MSDFKKDLIISAVVGLLCAILILPIAKNLGLNQNLALSLLVILPVLSAAGMAFACWLARRMKVFHQISKFILVGALNTFVDWGILNLLMFLAAITAGPMYSVFKGISFLAATINSYFWNKLWTFRPATDVARALSAMDSYLEGQKAQSRQEPMPKAGATSAGTASSRSGNIGLPAGQAGNGTMKEMSRFFLVSLVGFLLNVSVATLLVNVFGPQFGLSANLWANVGALAGTMTGLTWNFAGYKLIVFKS